MRSYRLCAFFLILAINGNKDSVRRINVSSVTM